jgi:hypothetical protein
MVNRGKLPKPLRNFLLNRKGTAEVIGSVLFIVIILFFFSSVYLWHDSATKTMNNLLSDKLNSQIEVNWLMDEEGVQQNSLLVTNTGGVGTDLSRLWIVTSSGSSAKHLYASLEDLGANGLHLAAGNTLQLDLTGGSIPTGSEIIASSTSTGASVAYTRTKAAGETFTVLTAMGNMASPQGTIKVVNQYNGNNGGNGGSAPVGSVIVANFSTFNYYKVSESLKLSDVNNDYTIDSNGDNIAFSLNLTNKDEKHRTIILEPDSQMFYIGIKNDNLVTYVQVYIIKVSQDGIIQEPFVSQGLDYNKEVTVYFGSKVAENYDPYAINNQIKSGAYPLNLALLGRFSDGESFGQNIPFVTVNIKD